MKFKVGRNVDYVQGHLRYGHKETLVEAKSKEELEEKLKDENFVNEIFEDSDLVVDDYEVDDYGEFYDDPWIIEEVKEDNYDSSYVEHLLIELKNSLDMSKWTNIENEINKMVVDFLKERGMV